jgi:hypothetical protein
LKFTLHRPGSPVASTCAHGMPCRDIPGRVHGSVAAVSASPAPEDSLALASLPVHSLALRARLARIRGTNFLNPARRLALHPAGEQTPARSKDGPVQPGLSSHVPARRIAASPGRARHVPDLQILDPNQVVPPSDVGRGFLGPVPQGISVARMRPHKLLLDSPTAVAAAGGLSQPALQPRHRTRTRRLAGGAVRQGQRHRDTAVNADDPGGARTWHPHRRRVAGQPADMFRLDRDDPEPFITPGFAPGWPPVRAGEEARHRLAEVPQRLPLHHLRPCRQPHMLGTRLRQLMGLSHLPGCAPAPGSPIPGLLFHRQIPHEPGMPAMLMQDRFLRRGRHQPVPGHVRGVLRATDIQIEGRERRFLPGTESGVPTPRYQ